MPYSPSIVALRGGHSVEARPLRSLVAPIVLLAAVGCGGGGGGGGSSPTPTVPDVALLLVSGHNGLFDGSPSASYLQFNAGPEIQADLISAGYTVSTTYFVDDAFSIGGYGGDLDLVDAM